MQHPTHAVKEDEEEEPKTKLVPTHHDSTAVEGLGKMSNGAWDHS